MLEQESLSMLDYPTVSTRSHVWKHNLNPKEKSMTSLNSTVSQLNAFKTATVPSPKKLQNV